MGGRGGANGRLRWGLDVLTMVTGTLLLFHLLSEHAATKKEKKQAQVETNVYADQTTGTALSKKKWKMVKKKKGMERFHSSGGEPGRWRMEVKGERRSYIERHVL